MLSLCANYSYENFFQKPYMFSNNFIFSLPSRSITQIHNSLLLSQFTTTDFLKPTNDNFLTILFQRAFLKATITIYLQHFSKEYCFLTLVQRVFFTIKVFSINTVYLQHSFNKYFSPSMCSR